jgi:hypothetical protein
LKEVKFTRLLKEAQEQSSSQADFAGVHQQLAQLLSKRGVQADLPQKCVAVDLVCRAILAHM